MSEKYEHLVVPGPTITTVSKPFWDAIARHEFYLQKCTDCDQWIFTHERYVHIAGAIN